VTAAALAIAFAAATPSAIASTALLARGQTGGFPWSLRVSSKTLQSQPAICVTFLWAWGPGQPIGNGGPDCVAAAKTHSTGSGLVWSFDLRAVAEGWDGVIPDVAAGAMGPSEGVRGVFLIVDLRASRAVATLQDREVLHMRTHSLPRELHRPARIAWAIQPVNRAHARGSATTVRHAVAYDKRGHVVGRFPPPGQ
jgi:hypothetical protein